MWKRLLNMLLLWKIWIGLIRYCVCMVESFLLKVSFYCCNVVLMFCFRIRLFKIWFWFCFGSGLFRGSISLMRWRIGCWLLKSVCRVFWVKIFRKWCMGNLVLFGFRLWWIMVMVIGCWYWFGKWLNRKFVICLFFVLWWFWLLVRCCLFVVNYRKFWFGCRILSIWFVFIRYIRMCFGFCVSRVRLVLLWVCCRRFIMFRSVCFSMLKKMSWIICWFLSFCFGFVVRLCGNGIILRV